MKLSLGCDHAGFPIKDRVVRTLRAWGHKVIDHGCHDQTPVDFPDIARKVCQSVLSGDAERGVMLCGSGVGAAIACNKIKGIRACCCHDLYSSHQCVEHDNVQIACFGADVVGPQTALELLHSFLNAQFSADEAFRRRVAKLDEMDAVR